MPSFHSRQILSARKFLKSTRIPVGFAYMQSRSVFRTLKNIYDKAFFAKIVND